MIRDINVWLTMGAILSAIAAFLHVIMVFKGAPWYRFFGAGERLAQAAEQGRYWPHIITLGIASVLALWSIYALSGAGVIRILPFMAVCLVGITSIYLLRGFALLPALLLIKGEGRAFAIWSSGICLLYGVVHAVGVYIFLGKDWY